MAASSYAPDSSQIADAMTVHLNTWEDKPCDLIFEDMTKEPDSSAMMIQQLARAKKKKSYVNGDYIGAWVFAVYIKVDATDSSARLGAINVLNSLGEWMSEKDSVGRYTNLPSLGDNRAALSLEMVNSPSLASKGKNGTDSYQAVFELDYVYSK